MGLNSRNFASLINNGNSILTTLNYGFTILLSHYATKIAVSLKKLIHSVMEIYFMKGRDSL